MPTDITDHYDRHLGPVYSWMAGDFDAAAGQMADYFDAIGLQPFSTRLAVDLGCGHGLQAIPLARRGYTVLALDTCQRLLDALAMRAENLPIRTIHADLRNFPAHLDSQADAIVCMGDTLTHLASADDVRTLVSSVASALAPGGTFCVSFRDYATSEPTGTSRFIPVRSDDERILTCFLEYKPDVVHVHDLLYTRDPDGWAFSVSSYHKLRLPPQMLQDAAAACGLQLRDATTARGMLYYAFTRDS